MKKEMSKTDPVQTIPQENENKPTKPNTTSTMKAVSVYSPRIVQERTVDMDQITELIAGRSSLNEGTVTNVLRELMNVILFHLKTGSAVKVDALGTFTPKISMDGTFSISHLPSVRLKTEMNKKGWFIGNIKNREMIGKSVDDLVTLWNREHPDDQIKT